MGSKRPAFSGALQCRVGGEPIPPCHLGNIGFLKAAPAWHLRGHPTVGDYLKV